MLLENGANPNEKTDYGNTALKCARRSNNTQVIELLKAAGAFDE
jgi:ankyrin repeat protein